MNTTNAGFVTQAAVAFAASEENAQRMLQELLSFPAVSQCLFFHQSIPVAVCVSSVTHSEGMCKHDKSRKLTENQAVVFSISVGFFISIQFICSDCSAEINRLPFSPLMDVKNQSCKGEPVIIDRGVKITYMCSAGY